MKHGSFSSYFETQKSRVLTESDLVLEAKFNSLRKQFWPKFSVGDMFKIMKYSSDWNSSSDLTTVMIKNVNIDNLKELGQFFVDFSLNNTSSQALFGIRYGGITWSKNVAQILKGEKQPLTGTAHWLFLFTYWLIASGYAKIDKDKAENLLSMFSTMVKDFNDVDCALGMCTEVSESEIDNLHNLYNEQFELSKPLSNILKWFLNLGYKAVYGKKQKDPSDTRSSLNAVCSLEEKDSIVNKTKEFMSSQEVLMQMFEPKELPAQVPNPDKPGKMMPDPTGKKIVMFGVKGSKKQIKDLYGALKVFKSGTASINPDYYNSIDISVDSVDDFCKNLWKVGIQSIIRTFDYVRNGELDTLKNRLDDVKRKHAEKYEDDPPASDEVKKQRNAELSEQLQAVEAEVKASWKIGKELDQMKDIRSVMKITDNDPDEIDEDADKSPKSKIDAVDTIEFDESKVGQRCAKRRMKLFEAAAHHGAEIIKTADWVVAVCKNAKLTAPFGRLKPKVKPGTNEIDPATNLEDWEGITPENKKIRDDASGKYPTIKDGIDDGHGHSFDSLHGEQGQSANGVLYAETGWCVTGTVYGDYNWGHDGVSSSFNSYTNGGTRPMIVYMSVKRGALYMYSEFVKNGTVVENFLNENEKVDGDSPTGSDPSDERQTDFVYQFMASNSSFKKLHQAVLIKYYPDLNPDVGDIEESEPVFGDIDDTGMPTTVGGKCAARRMKLFDAAAHEGATVIKTKNWIAAVCTTGYQCHPFCRLKPIVKEGTNEIDPDCNLEDWEGITPENKAKRDDVNNSNRIRDNIDDGHGHSFNVLKNVSGQGTGIGNAESAWCVCGACDGQFKWGRYSSHFFESYAGTASPIIVYMSTKRGAMYMFGMYGGRIQFDNESDCIDGHTNGNDSSHMPLFYAEFLNADASFRDLSNKLVAKYYKHNLSSSKHNVKDLIAQAQAAGLITENGSLILSRGNASTYKALFETFSSDTFTRIVIDPNEEDVSSMFYGMNLQYVKSIDFSNIRAKADDMFYEANIGDILLLNTHNITSMRLMFRDANINSVSGLDTHSAATIYAIFLETTTLKGAKLKIQNALDLTNCEDISYAFYMSNIDGIRLINTGKVLKAIKTFERCKWLSTFPNVKFDRIANPKQFGLDDFSKFSEVFNGCMTLQSKTRRKRLNVNPELDFDANIAECISFYNENKKQSILIDERGYAVFTSAQAVYDNITELDNYPGIKIAFEDATGLFEDKPVKIRNIDLADVKNATSMFYDTDISRLDAIENALNIVVADNMFYNARASIIPPIEFKNLTSCKYIFKCSYLSEIPVVDFGSKLPVSKITYVDIFNLTDSSDTVKNVSKARLETFIQKHAKKAAESYQFNYDDKGFIIIESKDLFRDIMKNFNLFNSKKKIEGFTVDPTKTSFYDCQFKDVDLPVIDIQNKTSANSMFKNTLFKSMSGIINTSQLKDTTEMFADAEVLSGKFPEFDMSNVEFAHSMFYGAEAKEPYQTLKLSSLRDSSSMFSCSRNVVNNIDLDAAGFMNTVENAVNMFLNAGVTVETHGSIHMPNCTLTTNVFKSSDKNNVVLPAKIDLIVCEKATSVNAMFSRCTSIQYIKKIDLPSASNLDSMFYGASNLKRISILNIPVAAEMSNMFRYTSSLEAILVVNLNPDTSHIYHPYMFEDSLLALKYGTNGNKFFK